MEGPIYKSRQLLFDFQCYEDINSMVKKEDGRHCSSCDKILIDFRSWKNEDIRNYLNENKSEHVCGYFNPHQIISDTIIKPKTHSRHSIFHSAHFALLAMAAVISGCSNESSHELIETEKEEKSELNEEKLDTLSKKSSKELEKKDNQASKNNVKKNINVQPDVCVITDIDDSKTYITSGIPAPDYEEPKVDLNFPMENARREVNDFVDETAKFPGGDQAMYDFISKNLVYPKKAKENNIEGKVYIQITIEANGEISETKILKGTDDVLNTAALEIINKMPKWIPGKIKTQPVASRFVLPIHFKLK